MNEPINLLLFFLYLVLTAEFILDFLQITHFLSGGGGDGTQWQHHRELANLNIAPLVYHASLFVLFMKHFWVNSKICLLIYYGTNSSSLKTPAVCWQFM